MLCGYEDFSNMAYYLKRREKELSDKLGLLNGIPSYDTFSLVFRTINPNEFMDLFVKWTKQMYELKRKQITIDGNAIKSATDKVDKEYSVCG